jgi:drug/metabolite transporter (DMT)-like permease
MSINNTVPPSIAGPQAGQRPVALACLLVVGSLLGLSLIVAKVAVGQGTAPLAFLCLSMMGSGAVLMVGEWRQGTISRIGGRLAEYAVVTGALFAVPNAIGFLAVEHIGVGFLSLTFAFPILLTYLLTLSMGLEAFSTTKALGVGAGLAGGCILALSKVGIGASPTFWVVLAMMSPVTIAIANIYRTLRWPAGVSPMFLASAMLLCGGALLLPFALTAPGAFIDLIAIPNQLALLGVQTGIFSVLYYFYFVLQRLAGPVYLSQIGSIAAIVGTAVAVLMLHEAVPANLAIAGLFIAGGMMLFQFRGSRA